MPETNCKALLIERDAERSDLLRRALGSKGFSCIVVGDVDSAVTVLETRAIQLLFVADSLVRTHPERLLSKLRDHSAAVHTVLITGDRDVSVALEAIRAGIINDYVRAPLDLDEVRFIAEKWAEEDVDEPPPPSAMPMSGLIGQSRPMRQLQTTLERAAAGDVTVLVRGESGTGKELAARAVHTLSARANGPFVKVQCSALPDALLESELFGYERGAFTGAVARRPGRVEIADGGSLFLDEIGDITLPMQIKLLRLLQDRQYERLGSNKTLSANVRFIAATHRDLEEMVRRQQFREDLFYRLNVVPLWLPPLRARRSDIRLLAKHFCRAFSEINGRPGLKLTESALGVLEKRRWPGNVRQLQNFIERLVVMASGDVISSREVVEELNEQVQFSTQATGASSRRGPDSRPLSSRRDAIDSTRGAGARDRDGAPASAHGVGSPPSSASGPVRTLAEEVLSAERRALERALKHTRGNRAAAARILGVSRATLYNKLEEHQLR